jgi:8-oxo-dGTP diphosphatase
MPDAVHIAARQELAREVTLLAPLDAIEAAHQADALGWIASGAEVYRLEKPATPPKHLVVYAAILDQRHDRVFLIEHRNAGLWLPTGGHVDPGEHPFAAARRELLEETGTSLPALSERALFLTVQDTVGDPVQRHTDVALWYGFVAGSDARFTLDPDECGQGAWFERDMLRAIACEPNLLRFMRKIGNRVR